MPGPPAAFLDHHKEPGVWHVFADRKIYHLDKLFFKRTLRRHEWTDLGDDFLVQPTAAMPSDTAPTSPCKPTSASTPPSPCPP